MRNAAALGSPHFFVGARTLARVGGRRLACLEPRAGCGRGCQKLRERAGYGRGRGECATGSKQSIENRNFLGAANVKLSPIGTGILSIILGRRLSQIIRFSIDFPRRIRLEPSRRTVARLGRLSPLRPCRLTACRFAPSPLHPAGCPPIASPRRLPPLPRIVASTQLLCRRCLGVVRP